MLELFQTKEEKGKALMEKKRKSLGRKLQLKITKIDIEIETKMLYYHFILQLKSSIFYLLLVEEGKRFNGSGDGVDVAEEAVELDQSRQTGEFALVGLAGLHPPVVLVVDFALSAIAASLHREVHKDAVASAIRHPQLYLIRDGLLLQPVVQHKAGVVVADFGLGFALRGRADEHLLLLAVGILLVEGQAFRRLGPARVADLRVLVQRLASAVRRRHLRFGRGNEGAPFLPGQLLGRRPDELLLPVDQSAEPVLLHAVVGLGAAGPTPSF